MPCSFSLFALLPPELQDVIWKYTLSDPRIISGENCFLAWWHHRIGPFLLPAALHVCRRSRCLARGILKRTLISIPGIPLWRIIYINQASDYIYVTKKDVQLQFDISTLIHNPAVVSRVMVSNTTTGTDWCSRETIRFFDQFSSLKEVIFTNRRHYSQEICIYEPIPKLRYLFEDRARDILVVGLWL